MDSRLAWGIGLAMWLTVASAASAGTYDVRSCQAAENNANNAWIAANTAPEHISTSEECPPATDLGGVSAFDVLGSSTAPSGARAQWAFTAPRQAVITRWRYRRWLGKDSDPNWHVFTAADSRLIDTCEIDPDQGFCDVGGRLNHASAATEVQNLAATALSIGFVCSPKLADSRCTTGGLTIHNVWAALYSSIVTLEENGLPDVGVPAGALVEGGNWKRGVLPVSFSAQDGVGVKETRVYVDGEAVDAVARACDYTRPVPCTNPDAAVVHEIDTRELLDGNRNIEVAAVDAAANERRRGVRIAVDNNAPSAAVVAARAVDAPDEIRVSWSGSDGTGSGVVSYDVEVSIDGGPFGIWRDDATGTGGTYAGAEGHRYRFRARAHDVSGLTSTDANSEEIAVSTPAREDATATPPVASENQSDGGGGAVAPPAGDGSMNSRPLSANIRLTRMRATSFGVRVTGRSAVEAGRLTVSAAIRAGKRRFAITRATRVRNGRFDLVLPLPLVSRGRTALITVRYLGDTTRAPQTVRRRARFGTR